jgi:hypothetical protein
MDWRLQMTDASLEVTLDMVRSHSIHTTFASGETRLLDFLCSSRNAGMALQTERQNMTQQSGVIAGSAAVMFAGAATTEGLVSAVMFVAATVTILSAFALYAVAYREREN